MVCQYPQQLAIWRIVTQLPEHHPSQFKLSNAAHLRVHRLRAVITPELALVPQGAGRYIFIIVAIGVRQRFELAVADGIRGAAGGLVESVIFIFGNRPAFAVEGNAKSNFSLGHARDRKSTNGVITI